jgi:hypothetical protein
VNLEKMGIPQVYVVTDSFRTEFETRAWGLGMPQVPRVYVWRMADWSDPVQLRGYAEEKIDEIIEALTQPTTETFTPEVEDFITEYPRVLQFEGEDPTKDFQEFFNERLWSIGLPLVPPTEERVAEMLTGTKLSPDEVVSVIDPLRGKATVEKIAINAVMAGCKPEDMPVLIAAAKAMKDVPERLNMVAGETTANIEGTHVYIAGPIVEKLNIGSVRGARGPHASTANSRLGYAIRLMITNIGGSNLELSNNKGQSYGGTVTCNLIAEMPPEVMTPGLMEPMKNRWTPLQVTLGYEPEDSVVLITGGIPRIANCGGSNPGPPLTAYEMLEGLASGISGRGVLIVHWHFMDVLSSGGISKEFVRDWLLKNTNVDPENFLIVVSGSPGGQNCWVPFGHEHWEVQKIEE